MTQKLDRHHVGYLLEGGSTGSMIDLNQGAPLVGVNDMKALLGEAKQVLETRRGFLSTLLEKQ
jgi:hypothetical protein